MPPSPWALPCSNHFDDSSLISLLRHVRLQYFLFVIHSAPQIRAFSSNIDEDFVQVPLPLRTLPYRIKSPLPNLMSEVSSEAINSMRHCFVTKCRYHVHKQVFYIAQRQRKPDGHHHRELNDFGGCLDIAERGQAHFRRLNSRKRRLKVS